MCSAQTLECEVEYMTDLNCVSLTDWDQVVSVLLIECEYEKINRVWTEWFGWHLFLFSKITAAVPTQLVIVLTGPKHQECICADSSLAPAKPCHQQQLATAVGTEWMCDGKTRQQVSVSIAQLGHMKARKSFALLLPTSTSRLSRLLTHYEDHACREANQQQQ